MHDCSTDALRHMIHDAYGCGSAFVGVVPVVVRASGKGWLAAVTVFRLLGHATAAHCYAWSRRVENTGRNEFVLVLEDGLVNSAEAAVRSVQGHFEATGTPLAS